MYHSVSVHTTAKYSNKVKFARNLTKTTPSMTKSRLRSNRRARSRDQKLGSAYSSDVIGDGPKANKKVMRKPPPKQKKKKQPKGMSSPLHGLSGCAQHYFLAIAKPFHPDAAGACVPSFPARLSQKTSSFMRGTFSIGTAGVGYVAVAPVVSNDSPILWLTGNNFSGTSINVVPTALATGVTSVNMTTNLFPTSSYNDGTTSIASTLTTRIISCAIRIRYTGTELNKSGLVYALVEPDHSNVNSLSINSIGAYKECIVNPVTRNWTEVVASAIDNDETNYPDSTQYNLLAAPGSGQAEQINMIYPFSRVAAVEGGSLFIGAPIIAIMVTGAHNNTYEYEIIQHAETVGRPVQSVSTKSHSDIQGMSTVTSAAGQTPALRGSDSTLSQSAAMLLNVAKEYHDNRQVYNALGRTVLNAMSSGQSRGNLRRIEF